MPLTYSQFRIPWSSHRRLSAITLVLSADDADAPDVTPCDALDWALDLALERLRSEGEVSGELEAWLQEESLPG